jgi:hypothetical protein
MGGAGEAPNPELLFAAGYAACFHSALQSVARAQKVSIEGSSVGSRVGIGPNGQGGFQLAVELEVNIPESTSPSPSSSPTRPPGVPVLERHPRQHRGHRHRRRRLISRTRVIAHGIRHLLSEDLERTDAVRFHHRHHRSPAAAGTASQHLRRPALRGAAGAPLRSGGAHRPGARAA